MSIATRSSYYLRALKRTALSLPGRSRLLIPGLRPRNLYQHLYETHAHSNTDADAVGGGPFEVVGSMEQAVLEDEGLKPTDTLLDFGCGTGRLAVQAIPFLEGGQYIGADISKE